MFGRLLMSIPGHGDANPEYEYHGVHVHKRPLMVTPRPNAVFTPGLALGGWLRLFEFVKRPPVLNPNLRIPL